MNDDTIPLDEPPAPADDALAKAEQQRDDYLTLLKQQRADFENYQKRAAREREQEWRYAHAPFAKDLLPALDNLERALAAAKGVGDDGPLAKGVELVQRQLFELLKKYSVQPVAALGQPFDPERHEAVGQLPSDQPAGTVLQVLQAGYTHHERVLRPASVIVSG